jgi:hypothetical protein
MKGFQTRLIGGIAQMTASDMFWVADDARKACLGETIWAQWEGREFTRIYWYYPERWGTPVLTMWDMNDPQDGYYHRWTDETTKRLTTPRKR